MRYYRGVAGVVEVNSKDREPSQAFATTLGGVVFVALWIFLGTRPTNAGIAPDSINTMRMQLSLLISGMGLPCTFNVTHEQPLTSDWGRLRRRWPLNF